MAKFKVGDTVERVRGDHGGMTAGKRDVVKRYNADTCFDLEKFGDGHDPEKFKLVTEGPDVITLANVETIEGDVVELIRCAKGVSEGRVVTIKGLRSTTVTLEGWSGDFRKVDLKLKEQPSSRTSDLKNSTPSKLLPVEVGDKVVVVGFGWGIGKHSYTEGQSIGTIVDLHANGQLSVQMPTGEVYPHVVRASLRKLTDQPEKKPMAKLSKTPTGVVADYKGLSKPRTVREQQTHVNRVLRDFKRRLASSVWVCGGAPRNWDHGRIANDIDVYFYMSGSKASFCKAAIASHLGIQSDDIIKLGSQSDAYYGLNGIKFVYQVKLGGQEYQFIVMDSPVGTNVADVVLDSFNCDLCKIAWDPINEAYERTTDYKTDRDMKRLTYRMYKLEESNAKLSMERHVPKLMKQFPEHTVVIYQEDPMFF